MWLINQLHIKLGFVWASLFLWVINLTRKIGKSDLLMIYLYFRSCFLAKLKKSLMSSNRHNLSKYKNRFSDKLQNASPVLTFRYFIKEEKILKGSLDPITFTFSEDLNYGRESLFTSPSNVCLITVVIR